MAAPYEDGKLAENGDVYENAGTDLPPAHVGDVRVVLDPSVPLDGWELRPEHTGRQDG